jgi:hypothetical protein
MPDILEYLDYARYNRIWYYEQDTPFPDNGGKKGKGLGVAHRLGQALCYYILTEQGKPIVRSTIQAPLHSSGWLCY